MDPTIDSNPTTLHSWSGKPSFQPERVGPYRILGILGEGGMGTVYLAQQTSPIHRQVALKLIRPDVVTSEVTRRFEAEREALARMSHPNVAQVFEAGTTETGQPYFVIEYIPGLSIAEFCDQKRLDIGQRLELFIGVCHGVQHAHQKGIIHRDIKPANILVVEVQGRPIPKIIDFGIAKALDRPLTEEPIFTGDRLLGTPVYMSPEAINASAGGHDIDTRSDVYSLGLLLYELLVGVLPFQMPKAGLLQVIRTIAEVEAPRLGTRFDALTEEAKEKTARQRRTKTKSLRRQLRGDLDWICSKAMAKERSERYPSAAEMAADVGRHLKHLPVAAGPPSAAYRTRKYIRRHKATVASAFLLVLALVAGMVGRTLEARRANLEAQRANREAVAAQQVSDFLVEIFEIADPFNAGVSDSLGKEITAQEILKRGALRVGSELQDQPAVQAKLLNTIGVVFKNLGLYEDAEPLIEDALTTQRKVFGEDNLDVAKSLHNLADLRWRQGIYAEAEPLHRDALELRRRLLGEQHLDVAVSLNDLALVLHFKGEGEEAEAMLRESLIIKRELLGDAHRKVALGWNNLASVLYSRGDYQAAEPFFRKALAMYRHLLGEDHPEVANSLSNLGMVMQAKGAYDVAEPLFRESLSKSRRSLGDRHPRVATGLNNLALTLHYQGSLEAAEPLYREALGLFVELLGDSHPDVAVLQTNLASLLVDRGELGKAENRVRRALEVFRKRLPATHWRIANAESVLGACLSGGRRSQEAETLLDRSFLTLREKKGVDSRYTQDALRRLIVHYEARGMSPKAAELRPSLTKSQPSL